MMFAREAECVRTRTDGALSYAAAGRFGKWRIRWRIRYCVDQL